MNMKIQIDFFKNELVDAIGAGIYEISVCKNGKSSTLYVGESVFVLVRCASHLYNLKKNPEYLGFTEKTIEDSEISLCFHLIQQEKDAAIRKKDEKKIIKEKNPLSQSGISDCQKNIEERIEALTKFLEELE